MKKIFKEIINESLVDSLKKNSPRRHHGFSLWHGDGDLVSSVLSELIASLSESERSHLDESIKAADKPRFHDSNGPFEGWFKSDAAKRKSDKWVMQNHKDTPSYKWK